MGGGNKSTTTTDQSGTSNSNTSNSSSTDPWAAQQPYINQAFQKAQEAYAGAYNNGPYDGNYVATGTGQQRAANTNAYDWANGTGTSTVGNILSNGSDMYNSGSMTANSAIGNLLNNATQDQTGNTLATANAYANNPFIAQATNAAMTSANQEAANSTLPSLYRNAAATGNINSDRTAISDGQVRSDLAQKAADISANLSSSAWNTGLNNATQQQSMQNAALGTAASLGSQQQQSGLNALSTGINDMGAVNNQAQGGANANQALNQLGVTNSLDQWQGTQQYPWTALSNYYNIVGNRSWGNSTSSNGSTDTNTTQNGTSETQQQPSMMSSIGSIMGMFGSFI